MTHLGLRSTSLPAFQLSFAAGWLCNPGNTAVYLGGTPPAPETTRLPLPETLELAPWSSYQLRCSNDISFLRAGQIIPLQSLTCSLGPSLPVLCAHMDKSLGRTAIKQRELLPPCRPCLGRVFPHLGRAHSAEDAQGGPLVKRHRRG